MEQDRPIFKKQELKREYIDLDTRKNYLESTSDLEQWINNDFRKALEAEGLTLDLALAQRLSISRDAIKDEINTHRKKYLASLGFVPKSEIDRVHEKFNEVINNLTKPCQIFIDYTSSRKFPLVANKQGYITFDAEKVTEYVSTIGVKTFTDSEMEYMNLLQDAADLLIKIRHHEIDNDFNPFVLNMLSQHIATGFDPIKVFTERRIKKYHPTN